MQQSQSFTLKGTGILLVLQTPCGICAAFDPAITPPPHPQLQQFQGIWDTGATASVITEDVVQRCGLKPTGMTQVHGVHGTELTETFLVNIQLPNGVHFKNVRVSKGKLAGGAHALIGMDIITTGDFCITNKGGITTFTFRHPSIAAVDYVKEYNLQQKFQHGGTKPDHKKAPKQFGKNKKKKRK